MTTLLLVACVGMIAGAFLILRISPMDFTQGIFRRLTSAPKSIRSDINESTHRKKKSFLRREIEDAQAILKATGKEVRFPMDIGFGGLGSFPVELVAQGIGKSEVYWK